MDFILEMVGLTIVMWASALFFLKLGEKYQSLVGIIGAFSLIGALGCTCFLGLIIAIAVWSKVSDATFSLLGLIAGSPFLIAPIYLCFKLLRKSQRESDGRGFGDGEY